MCADAVHAEHMLLQVVELGGAKVLVVETDGEVFAVSNKCSHLGLPLVGE
jgi:nitrite reductase/ring-hydroxylating ferredoxin subunit